MRSHVKIVKNFIDVISRLKNSNDPVLMLHGMSLKTKSEMFPDMCDIIAADLQNNIKNTTLLLSTLGHIDFDHYIHREEVTLTFYDNVKAKRQ